MSTINCLFWNVNNSVVKLMISMTSGANAENLRQYKSRFFLLIIELTLLEKLKNHLKISNELHDDVLHYNSHSDKQIHFIVKL